MALPKSGGEVVEWRAVSRITDNVLYIDVSLRLEPQDEWINITVVPDLSSEPQPEVLSSEHQHEWETWLWPILIIKCRLCGERQTISSGRG